MFASANPGARRAEACCTILPLAADMIPESAARRVACLAGHISQQGEQGQDATCLSQQVGNPSHSASSCRVPSSCAKVCGQERFLLTQCVSDVQDCAAKHTLQYARACSFTDLKFARPAAPEVLCFYFTAIAACLCLSWEQLEVRVLYRLTRFRLRRQP